MIDQSTINAMDAKLAELDAAAARVGASYSTAGILQDALYGGHITGAQASVQNGLILLHTDLYQAVLGERTWPLDVIPGQIDPDGALGSWNQLALSTQQAIDSIGGYINKWGPLPTQGLLEALKPGLNPFNWPWYVQAAAGAVILYYGAQTLGMIGSAKSAFAGRRRRR